MKNLKIKSICLLFPFLSINMAKADVYIDEENVSTKTNQALVNIKPADKESVKKDLSGLSFGKTTEKQQKVETALAPPIQEKEKPIKKSRLMIVEENVKELNVERVGEKPQEKNKQSFLIQPNPTEQVYIKALDSTKLNQNTSSALSVVVKSKEQGLKQKALKNDVIDKQIDKEKIIEQQNSESKTIEKKPVIKLKPIEADFSEYGVPKEDLIKFVSREEYNQKTRKDLIKLVKERKAKEQERKKDYRDAVDNFFN